MDVITQNTNILKGIEIIKKEKEFKLFNEKITINLHKHEANKLIIKRNKDNVDIFYNKINNLYYALFEIEANLSNEFFEEEINYNTSDLGIMIDCARNGAMNVQAIKNFIINLALIGYDSLQLYIEDVLSVKDEKMLGYMRGAYTINELKDIDDFASLFGIEVIPCIQTLAHYNQIFRYPEYMAINDIDDILLIDDDRTYIFLENIFKTVRQCFKSNKININMDEAMHFGRGKYLDKHGFSDSYKLLIKHKNRVIEIAKKYNYEPSMWSDMFFRKYSDNKYYVADGDIDFKGLFVDNVNLIFWDYYHTDINVYDNMIRLHKKISNNVSFAGGIWTWRGFIPHLHFTENSMKMAIKSCKKNNIKDIFFTMWGDNGNECLRNYSLGSLIMLNNMVRNEKVSKEKVNNQCKALLGYTYNEWLYLDHPNFIDLQDAKTYNSNPSKYLLYMDPLLSQYDAYINENYESFYNKLARRYNALAKRNYKYSYLFKNNALLCKALAYKATLNIKIKEAYDNKDVSLLKKCYSNAILAYRSVVKFHENYQALWKNENKMTGYEVIDIRLAGVESRLKYTKKILKELLLNPNITIEELEYDRKSVEQNYKTKNNEIMQTTYTNIVTTNRM